MEYISNNIKLINPFQINAPFLYPLKKSENRGFSDFFRGYRNETLICETGQYSVFVYDFGQAFTN